MRAVEFVSEEWSAKYKRSINCNNPKGFSQKAHCAGRRKNEDLNEGPEQDARAAGYQAFHDGVAKCPYAPGTEQAREWGLGWESAQARGWDKMSEATETDVAFEIDSEDAYNAVLDRFGSVIEWSGDHMVAPRKYWSAIQEVAYDNGGEATEAGDEQLDELTFKGSPCTKDCSGHRAGYEWSQRKGGVDAASWSPSFNNGAALFKHGF